jgi:hypothetical protein
LSKKRRPIKYVWPKEEVTTMQNRIETTIETTSPPMTEEITETTSTEVLETWNLCVPLSQGTIAMGMDWACPHNEHCLTVMGSEKCMDYVTVVILQSADH